VLGYCIREGQAHLRELLRFATALIDFLVSLPIIGYATWHAYKETIDASAWEKNSPAEDA